MLPFDIPLAFEVVVVDDVFETVVEVAFEAFMFEFMFERFALLAVLFAVSPPQAAPRAAKPKRAESAIAFFMKKFLLSSSKINLDFLPEGSYAPKLFLFLEQTK